MSKNLITRIIWIHDSFYMLFYKINFSDFSLSVVYSDQLFGVARSILHILSR